MHVQAHCCAVASFQYKLDNTAFQCPAPGASSLVLQTISEVIGSDAPLNLPSAIAILVKVDIAKTALWTPGHAGVVSGHPMLQHPCNAQCLATPSRHDSGVARTIYKSNA